MDTRSQGGPEPPLLVNRYGGWQPSMPTVSEQECQENGDLQQSDYRVHLHTPKACPFAYKRPQTQARSRTLQKDSPESIADLWTASPETASRFD